MPVLIDCQCHALVLTTVRSRHGKPTFNRDEPLDGLQEDANPQGKKKYAIEEGAEQFGSLPTKGEVLACFGLF